MTESMPSCDVTDPEANVPDSPLWTLPNIMLTPYAAGSVGKELRRLGDGAVTTWPATS
ncbi:hypothetical protein HMPREF9597_00921 [Cutibacterium acnes HL005PA4]|nr:hypothetical protein HMPREF9576_00946 [Cutibacterium acnes HL110PA2]EFS45017.1 hypothetical protein HMPREF9580_02278 [Cutibacterium acnes HL087PA2]EFS69536.1 hypothetical protein HMPREF9616_00627 [Cutibacterium acnes HL007PA1]EFS77849.1 hypothetical protein HMPREF9591_00184 [Cutibacterium acnes HL086PA1]EFS79660.1 hypothetical protein HMPREF9597_00921 [Cutibacterium acnes HL005PA4]EFS80934.1 hypothetical protein HMPREF9598_02434 [Cutibacterium acnes HL050PA1]EFT50545.1 hypothetical protein